jgi:hypothetical protein
MIDLLRLLAPPPAAPPPASAAPPPLFDIIRLQAMIYEESRRIHDLLFDRLIGPALRPADDAEEGPAPDGQLSAILRRAQLLLLKHPVAAQAAYAALIAEGRRFAATPEGAEWASALAGSEELRRSRRVWDAVGMNLLEDDPATIVPSRYLEALLGAARSADLTALLRGLHGGPRAGEDDRGPAR